MRIFILSFFIFTGVYIWSQNSKQDTLLVWTDKSLSFVEQHYVIDGSRELKITQYENKNDTTNVTPISDYTWCQYKELLNLIKIRNFPIERIDADKVFDYFYIGESEISFLRRLRKKKVYLHYGLYLISFYNKSRKKMKFLNLAL